MPIFQYVATNAEGQTERGMVPGPTIDAVTRKLQSRGLQVTEVSLAATDDPLQEGLAQEYGPRSRIQTDLVAPLASQVSLAHLQFFFRQLAAMMNAGVGVAQCFDTLAKQSQSPKLQQILFETKDIAMRGEPISASFQRYPEVFTPLIMSMVRAGEEGGFLTEQCKRISEYLEREIQLRNIIRAATIYPKVTLVSSIIIILAANWIIDSVGRPGAEKLLSPLTSPATWVILGPILVGVFFYVKVVRRQPHAQYQWDSVMVRLPGLGNVIHGFAMAKFGRSFGALYSSGVPLPRAVKLSADACGNQYVRTHVYPAADELERGGGITDAFARTGAFSPIVLDMTRTGEMTGNIDEMLLKLAEFYEDEGATKAKQFAVIFGVVVLALVGAYVGYVYITNMVRILGGAAQEMQ